MATNIYWPKNAPNDYLDLLKIMTIVQCTIKDLIFFTNSHCALLYKKVFGGGGENFWLKFENPDTGP